MVMETVNRLLSPAHASEDEILADMSVIKNFHGLTADDVLFLLRAIWQGYFNTDQAVEEFAPEFFFMVGELLDRKNVFDRTRKWFLEGHPLDGTVPVKIVKRPFAYVPTIDFENMEG